MVLVKFDNLDFFPQTDIPSLRVCVYVCVCVCVLGGRERNLETVF